LAYCGQISACLGDTGWGLGVVGCFCNLAYCDMLLAKLGKSRRYFAFPTRQKTARTIVILLSTITNLSKILIFQLTILVLEKQFWIPFLLWPYLSAQASKTRVKLALFQFLVAAVLQKAISIYYSVAYQPN
jgi:hypothetical protein